MAALHRALALAERDDGAVRVGEQLDLDVARPLEVALEENAVVAERRLRLARGRLERVVELGRPSGRRACRARRRPPPPSRSAGSRARPALPPGTTGTPASIAMRSRLELVAAVAQRVRRRADPQQAGRAARLGEVAVLGQEPVARDGSRRRRCAARPGCAPPTRGTSRRAPSRRPSARAASPRRRAPRPRRSRCRARAPCGRPVGRSLRDLRRGAWRRDLADVHSPRKRKRGRRRRARGTAPRPTVTPGDRAADRRAERLARRPRHVDQRERVAVVEPAMLGRVRRAGSCPACRTCRRRRRRRRSRRRGRTGSPATGGSRSRATVPISPTRTGTSGPRRSAMRPRSTLFPVSITPAISQIAADRDRAEAELVEPQRPEHAERPEEQRGEDDEPDRELDAAVAQRPRQHRERLRLAAAARRRRERPRGDPERRDRDGAERRAGARDGGDAAEHRPEERAGDGGRERLPDQRAAAAGRRRGDEPRQRACPRERARERPARSARGRAARPPARSRRARSSPRRSSSRSAPWA